MDLTFSGGSVDRGTLNRYLLILNRLIFESRVRRWQPQFGCRTFWARNSAPAFCQGGLNHFLLLPHRRAIKRATAATGFWALAASAMFRPRPKMSPSLRITARSITFCSSRMLPGHPYDWNSLTNFLSIVLNFFPALFPKRSMKYSTSKGISAARSRNGGIWIGTTFSLYRRSWRNFAFGDERVQIAMRGGQHSHVHRNGLLLPTRSISRSCSTRNSAIWISGGKSPTSSRKIVPPFADSKRPRRRCVAPVKAPFS